VGTAAEDNLVNDQAGITFYSGVAGDNPGSQNPAGADRSLFIGINDWSTWTHTVQGIGDNNPNSGTNGIDATLTDDTFEYRVEITEGGDSDTYNFFYREDPADPWTSYGPSDLEQTFDNTVVGLMTKSHNLNTTSSTQFDRLTVGLVPSTNAAPLTLSISEAGGNLSFSWISTFGLQYDLLSSTDLSTDPATWAPFNDGVTTHENIDAETTGINSLTDIPLSGQKRFFVLLEKAIPTPPVPGAP
jgi:hypothetical protein